ncbi:MAG: valine--tRNA ligase [Deltaproteobacteria bacterium CG11_big_fil_rev_8_21_14_0_20_49_13]|nr:MAG: valine--tRNA ligase [Deltaproteobacteria bacterium CG11_big_fil_rev_8_21_14_0_20_49_13]
MENVELAKAYEPKGVEDKWYAQWIEKGYFTPDPLSKKPSYTIVIPPPNVTGVLTMGHVLNNTLQDILVRRKKMQGFETLWLPGTDHAGIATQTVVERTLKKEGKIKHRDDLGREEFLKKTWEWKDKHGGIIIKQLKKLGCSCDWSREVFTMDGLDPRHPSPRINYSACVQKVFVELYKKGLIYRGKKMVNWCPVSRTALSDEEVVMKEESGHLWYFKYPMVACHPEGVKRPKDLPNMAHGILRSAQDDKLGYIVVATTRPETMLGDEAIAVNPKDKRYKGLIGKKVLLPLQNRPIPIIADDAVELGFGTGAVKVTPAHDLVDHEIGVRHKLPVTQVIGSDGRMTAAAGEKFEGMDRFECRKAVVVDMQELGLLEKTENYKHNVGYSQRADVPIEPMLSEQWFLKYPSVKEALKAVTSGKVKFWPSRWTKVYSHWLKGIRDWCISRQLWWGHRIPAWYCVKDEAGGRKQEAGCKPIVSIERPTRCPKCGATEFAQDSDVLDTWFSSWLWPFATMGWPNKTDLLKKFYPTTDLVTGPDIIFFWVARMIMAGYEFTGERPFDNVYFTGIIRDSQGRKMSKSLGNSPDPLDLIEKYGADGLRFGLMLVAPKGQDILFSEDRIDVGRNFMNKLWNASRFIMMNMADTCHPCENKDLELPNEVPAFAGTTELSLADKWILNKLQHTIKEVNKALDHYQFDAASRAIYQFVWGEFCDWYLELVKGKLTVNSEQLTEERKAAQATLLHVLDHILRLLHPYAPFITEEIWQKLPRHCEPARAKQSPAGDCFVADVPRNDTIMLAEFPTPPKKIEFEKEAKELQIVMDVIGAIRNIRGEHNVNPGKQIEISLRVHDKAVQKNIEKDKKYIMDLARIASINFLTAHETPKQCATAVAGKVDIFIPLAGMIDLGAEKTRLAKEIARIENYIKMTGGKLSNKNFVERAPKEVVAKERERLGQSKAELEKLRKALDEL